MYTAEFKMHTAEVFPYRNFQSHFFLYCTGFEFEFKLVSMLEWPYYNGHRIYIVQWLCCNGNRVIVVK